MTIDNNGKLVSYDELYHHGILGMHWGIRRYQPYPSGYHGDGKFTGKKSKSSSKGKVKETRKSESGSGVAEEPAKKTKEELMRNAKGNEREVLERKAEFTNKELKDFLERLELEKKLSINSAPAKKARSSGLKAAGRVMSTIGNKILLPLTVGTISYVIQRNIGEAMNKKNAEQNADNQMTTQQMQDMMRELFKGVNNWKK